jgi:hypothetical protein
MSTVSKFVPPHLSAGWDPQPRNRTRTIWSTGIAAFATSMSLLAPLPAGAVDGCVVLLCLAAPNWRAVPECVPPIRQLLRDLARGHAFPSCTMSGVGNTSRHTWASAPGNCPPQYTRIHEGPSGPMHSCDFSGSISVSVQGALFTRTWWSPAGDSVTEYSPAAKSQLGGWDTRFDDDFTAWLAAKPAPFEPIQ